MKRNILIGLLALTLVLAAGCMNTEPTPTRRPRQPERRPRRAPPADPQPPRAPPCDQSPHHGAHHPAY